MAGGNLSPRQKMIGMMYLVLTALLALNISKEIVLAFVLINTGIEHTTENFNKKNELTYNDFDFQESQNPGKVKPFNDKAKIVKKHADEITAYIEKLKREIMGMADQLPQPAADTITLEWVQSKDENNIPAQVMVGSSADGSLGKARELKNKLNEFKEKLMNLISQVDPAVAKKFELGIDTNDPPKDEEGIQYSWEMHYFGHFPLAPVITMLSKLQSDVRNAEADVINFLFSGVSKKDFKFDKLEAKVIPQSNYVFVGQEFKADVFVAAYSETQNPEILTGNVDTVKREIIGNKETIPVEKGLGKYTRKASAEGVQKWGGIINVKSPDGSVIAYPFKSEYIVAKPNAVVSPEKMNVLYIGVDNPIAVSVGGGLADEKIHVTLSGAGGSISGSKGKYIAKVSTKGDAVIRVTADFEGSKNQNMGEYKFRVKDVPDPVAKVANQRGGLITKSVLAAQPGIIADLENFEFEGVRYKVTSYDVYIAQKGKDGIPMTSKAGTFSPEMTTIFNKLRPGDKVFFENIKAVGPSGKQRDIGALNLTIK